MDSYLRMKAYGKINLALDVLGKREDGYHEVRMIMQTVGVFDQIEMQVKRAPGIIIENNLPFLPADENNLVYQATRLLMDEFSIDCGLRIKLKKVIPVAAGMAGGSADAAAVLAGVSRMFELGLSKQELMERGLRIGADVPYCILRGTALAEGIGEKLTPLPKAPDCHLVIAKPAVSVSTKYVYENLNLQALPAAAHPDIDGMVAAVNAGDLRRMAAGLGNILETVTAGKYPVIGQIKEELRQRGALNALMSGSGPTVFGIFEHREKARRAYEELRFGRAKGLAKQVYLTHFWT